MFSDDLGLRSSEKLERLISGASLPTENHMELMAEHYVLIPDEWGKYSDASVLATRGATRCLNPRLVGQVFRHFQTT